jgi:hypothetical protein
LDELIVYEDEGIKKVFASKGKTVMYVWYNGKANMEAVIEGVVEKISL